jgi:threonine synthase
MKFISTRGRSPALSFSDVLLSGTAPDGGLYLPETWPAFTPDDFAAMAGKSYAEIAQMVITPFVSDDINEADLRRILHETYETGAFDDEAVAPLVKLSDDLWLMELFHGPTLSFKDYALQCLGNLFDYVLAQKGERITIIGATSGDTGSAAIEACRGLDNVDIFILHPLNRTSEIQRKQMTTVDADNVFNIALEGTFDDCQAIVKSLFADQDLREELNLSAVNSINWARIMMQMVYYIAACVELQERDLNKKQPVSFSVPTGNFGNVFAAFAARKMGAPIDKLVIGTNRNDIITRFFESGEMKMGSVEPSISPSMDIQISSNFERYLCELLDRDFDALSNLMEQFKTERHFSVSDTHLQTAQNDFLAYRCDDEKTGQVMRACLEETSVMIDPHTAVGMHAMQTAVKEGHVHGSAVVLACAHPAKFGDAVVSATGQEPQMPDRLGVVMDKTEHVATLPNDETAIREFIHKKLNKA